MSFRVNLSPISRFVRVRPEAAEKIPF